jgi:hypothetical protein
MHRSKSPRQARPAPELLEPRSLLATITVNTAADVDARDQTLSLREAIEIANGTLQLTALTTQERAQVATVPANPTTIAFNVPGIGVQTIALRQPLPAITAPVVIDGYTQPGASPNTSTTADNAAILIEISSDVPDAAAIVRLRAGGSILQGLVIDGSGAPTAVSIGGPDARGDIVRGSFLGVNRSGTAVNIAGTAVVLFGGASDNTIGGTTPDARNLIAGGSRISSDPVSIAAISIGGSSTFGLQSERRNVVAGNFIGLAALGAGSLGGGGDGIDINGTAADTTIGGTTAGAGNSIVGRSNGPAATVNNLLPFPAVGVLILGPSAVVEGNRIGTNFAGAAGLGNQGDGVLAVGAGARILGNVIAGNAGAVKFGAIGAGVEAGGSGAIIQGNQIGTDSTGAALLGNLGHGILVRPGVTDLTVGGVVAGEPNVIANNAADGVMVAGAAGSVPAAMGVTILSNSIYGNGRLGIELAPGANNGVVPPVLANPVVTGGKTTLAGTVVGAAGAAFRIELFGNPARDPSGFGQGKTLLGSTTVAIGNDGQPATFQLVVDGDLTGQTISATATDSSGDTSSFAADVPRATGASVIYLTAAVTGPSVALTAVVGAAPGASVAGGVVTFAEGATTLAVVPVGTDSRATLTQAFSAGPHAITALFSGTLSAELSTATSGFTIAGAGGGAGGVATSPDGPVVVGLRRVDGLSSTAIVLAFNEPLDPATAQDLGNYAIAAPGSRRVRIAAAVYDASTWTVTLETARRLDPRRRYRVRVRGRAPGGVADTAGRLLDGLGNGQPGSDFVGTIARGGEPLRRRNRLR